MYVVYDKSISETIVKYYKQLFYGCLTRGTKDHKIQQKIEAQKRDDTVFTIQIYGPVDWPPDRVVWNISGFVCVCLCMNANKVPPVARPYEYTVLLFKTKYV